MQKTLYIKKVTVNQSSKSTILNTINIGPEIEPIKSFKQTLDDTCGKYFTLSLEQLLDTHKLSLDDSPFVFNLSLKSGEESHDIIQIISSHKKIKERCSTPTNNKNDDCENDDCENDDCENDDCENDDCENDDCENIDYGGYCGLN